MRIHRTQLKTGITRTKEFEKKGLATHAVNIGTKCGHGCLYCSTGAMLRMHPSFRDAGEDPFGRGYAIVDPSTPERVARDAARITKRGRVQLCTTVDAWAPEALEHELGRRCLAAILSQPGWSVRVLTKNVAVVEDFGFMEQHRDRILVGVSITSTADNAHLVRALEPNASDLRERMAAMREAAARGLRTYAMFCPLLPTIGDSQPQVDRLMAFAMECGAEEVYVEPVNPRGPGLRLCQEGLARRGYAAEAEAIGAIRKRGPWSRYVARLVKNVQHSVTDRLGLDRLRFLLYPSRLLPEDVEAIRRDDSGVIWLGGR